MLNAGDSSEEFRIGITGNIDSAHADELLNVVSTFAQKLGVLSTGSLRIGFSLDGSAFADISEIPQIDLQAETDIGIGTLKRLAEMSRRNAALKAGLITFGANIRQQRKLASLNQADLGAKVGITNAMVSLIESGQRRPSLSVLFLLISTLDLDPTETLNLLGYETSHEIDETIGSIT